MSKSWWQRLQLRAGSEGRTLAGLCAYIIQQDQIAWESQHPERVAQWNGGAR